MDVSGRFGNAGKTSEDAVETSPGGLLCWTTMPYSPSEDELAGNVEGTLGTFGNVLERCWNVPLPLVSRPV
jgi:hypothetical protein